MDDNKQTTNEKPMTLSTFIEENQKLISVIGVFTAVTLFSLNVKLPVYGIFLSFLFMSLTVLLWLELVEKFPPKGSTKLGWFESLLSIAILGFVFYWLLDFRSVWEVILPFVIQFIIASIVSYFIKKTNFFNRAFHAKPGEKVRWRYILFLIILLGSLYAGLYIGQLVSPSINNLLSMIQNILK